MHCLYNRRKCLAENFSACWRSFPGIWHQVRQNKDSDMQICFFPSGTQADSYAKGITEHGMQTDASSTASSTGSGTSGSNTTSTTTFTTTSISSSVPPEVPSLAPASSVPMETVWSPDQDEPDDSKDPLYEPFARRSFVA